MMKPVLQSTEIDLGVVCFRFYEAESIHVELARFFQVPYIVLDVGRSHNVKIRNREVLILLLGAGNSGFFLCTALCHTRCRDFLPSSQDLQRKIARTAPAATRRNCPQYPTPA